MSSHFPVLSSQKTLAKAEWLCGAALDGSEKPIENSPQFVRFGKQVLGHSDQQPRKMFSFVSRNRRTVAQNRFLLRTENWELRTLHDSRNAIIHDPHSKIQAMSAQAAPAASSRAAELENSLRTVIRGKDDVLRLALVSLFARGHLLIEGVPGVGKTTLGQALARAIDCTFQRVQFTSDMLPSDVLGISIYSAAEQKFEFKRGPVFANVLLADEINRTTPKTQSALLEAMNEGQVTVDAHSYPLPQPFLVIATQNPIEHHGTYPLAGVAARPLPDARAHGLSRGERGARNSAR